MIFGRAAEEIDAPASRWNSLRSGSGSDSRLLGGGFPGGVADRPESLLQVQSYLVGITPHVPGRYQTYGPGTYRRTQPWQSICRVRTWSK